MCCSRPRQAINTAQRAAPLVRSAGERSSAGAQTATATRAALALVHSCLRVCRGHGVDSREPNNP